MAKRIRKLGAVSAPMIDKLIGAQMKAAAEHPAGDLFLKGTEVRISAFHSEPGKGLSYREFSATMNEEGHTGGWDVYEVIPKITGVPMSVYGFSVHKIEPRNWENDLEKEVENAVDVIFRAINKMGSGETIFLKVLNEKMNREHRTLKQCFWGVIAKAILEYSHSQFDLRNEDSVKWAKEVAKIPPYMRYV